MSKRVVVTGIGLVSPIGCTVHEAWDKVLRGISCVTKLESVEYATLPSRIAAEVFVGDQRNQLNVMKYIPESKLRTMSRATSFAVIAAREALLDANWHEINEDSKQQTGVAVGMGMIDMTDVYFAQTSLNKSYSKVSPYFIPKVLPNMAASQISIEHGFQGPNHSVSTACATGAHSIGDAFNFIRTGLAKVMVCGGTESCISPLSVAGFCRLRALSTSFNSDPEKASRPFDKKRDGFVMAEGASIIILEELDQAVERGAKIYAEILGYGLSGDGAHLTAPLESGNGAVLAMKMALTDAKVNFGDVSYINAHATSTPLGDSIELKAIKKLFGNYSKHLTVSSTKGVHGHLLGAAGSIEVALSVLACYNAILPPTANLEDPCDEAAGLNCITEKQDWCQDRRIVLKNSFGFGGTNACLCISNFQK